MRVFLNIIIGLVVLFIAARLYIAFGVPAPRNLGVNNGQLSPCPDTPNCVSTRALSTNAEHFMPAIPYTSDASFALTQILRAVSSMPRVKVLQQNDTYLHAEFRSPTMGFPDDVEFYIDESNKLIHFRSAARLGRSDMGVNRNRMTELSEKIKTALSS
jgi:uncharacterized protein (DUF1499 family)